MIFHDSLLMIRLLVFFDFFFFGIKFRFLIKYSNNRIFILFFFFFKISRRLLLIGVERNLILCWRVNTC